MAQGAWYWDTGLPIIVGPVLSKLTYHLRFHDQIGLEQNAATQQLLLESVHSLDHLSSEFLALPGPHLSSRGGSLT